MHGRRAGACASRRHRQPPPDGVWGTPPDIVRTLPGYDPDVAKSCAGTREIMQKLGYGPDKRLAVTVSTRNIPFFRNAAVILIDQFKEIFIDGQIEPIEAANWYPKLRRKDHTLAFTVSEGRSTIPTKNYTKFMPAVGNAIIADTAIRRSTR